MHDMTQADWDNNPLMKILEAEAYASFLAQPKPEIEESEDLQDFKRFHEANPMVVIKIVEVALKLKQRGKPKYAIDTIIGAKVRWADEDILIDIGEKYKVNNDYLPAYSRLIMYWIPELEDFFEIRKAKCEDWDYSKISIPPMPGVR